MGLTDFRALSFSFFPFFPRGKKKSEFMWTSAVEIYQTFYTNITPGADSFRLLKGRQASRLYNISCVKQASEVLCLLRPINRVGHMRTKDKTEDTLLLNIRV